MTAGKWGIQFMIEETLTSIKTTLVSVHFVQAVIYNFLLFDIAHKGKKSKWMNFIVEHLKENKTINLHPVLQGNAG